MRRGRRSIMPFQTTRAASYASSEGCSSVPLSDALKSAISCAAAFMTFLPKQLSYSGEASGVWHMELKSELQLSVHFCHGRCSIEGEGRDTGSARGHRFGGLCHVRSVCRCGQGLGVHH